MCDREISGDGLIKVGDDRNLADGDVEMKKEWFRIRFGGRTDENCQ